MKDKKAFMQAALAPTRDLRGPPAPIVPFADWDFYYTRGLVTWTPPEGSNVSFCVQVPIGFVTDLASIPREFWAILSPHARYSYPAIIHDYLYWMQICTRDVADDVLKLAMKDMKVSGAQVFTIYKAVRIAGRGAWSSNSAMRQAGEKRILKQFPTDMNTTWLEWKANPDVFLP
jgi:hypothetical protein